MNFFPNQQRAIITGASSGVGKATALAFAKAGIDVALISRQAEKLIPVAQTASNLGVQAKAYPLDLAKISEVKSKIETIASEFGPIDILVNNAGIGYTNLLRETPLRDWQKVIDLNLTSIFQCVMGILPQMRARGKGTIINVASIAANNPFPEWGTYAVSKSALITFGQCLAAEERANGIRVTNISPGAVNTPIWDTETVKAELNRSAMLNPETVANAILQAVMLPTTAVIESMTITPSIGAL
jgi:short-subunit dehydrogenase